MPPEDLGHDMNAVISAAFQRNLSSLPHTPPLMSGAASSHNDSGRSEGFGHRLQDVV